jgi:hypothetical protein
MVGKKKEVNGLTFVNAATKGTPTDSNGVRRLLSVKRQFTKLS